MQKKGLVHIYTGDGKGKTTASVGLSIRALGHGYNVVYSSFFKRPGESGYNEIEVLKSLGATIFSFSDGMPMANPQITAEDYRQSTTTGLDRLFNFINENETDLLVLDEILIAVDCAYLSDTELIEFIQQKPKNLELVLTGRGATDNIQQIADYVTFLKKTKHPYDNGILAREGIEY